MDFNEAKRRYEWHKTTRTGIEYVWELVQRYVLPFRALFYSSGNTHDSSAVRWRRAEIYDDTAVDAAQTLASTINSNLTNPVLPWFAITTKDKNVNKQHDVRQWLEMVSERLLQLYQSTNFNLAASELYLDLVGFGTGSFASEVVERSNGTLKSMAYSSIPIDQGYFDEDEQGRPVNYYRRLNWTPIQIIDKFGMENVPAKIVELIKDPVRAGVRLPLLYVVFRRFDNDLLTDIRPLAPGRRPYGGRYFLLDNPEYDGKEIGRERGYYQMPVKIPRWRRTSGSQWGYAPSMITLSNIMTLNKLTEIIIAANDKIVDPPIFSTKRGIISDYNLTAGSVIDVTDISQIQQWQFTGRIDLAFLEKEEMQRQIRQAFFVDQLQLKESPAMTAYEVHVRYQLMQRLLGPSVGQIQYDFLGPQVQSDFQTLYRYGMLPPPPKALLRSGVPLDIEYLGPMAKAQKQDMMTAIERWIMSIVQVAQVFPEARDIPDVDSTVKELGHAAGVPTSIINSKAKIMSLRLKQQQQQEQVRNLAMAEGAGKAMQAVGSGKAALDGSVSQTKRAA